MYEAARQEDPIQHSSAKGGMILGLLAGAVVGAVVAAAVIASGGLALAAVGAALTATGSIGMAGKIFGSLVKNKDEKIDTGSTTIQIGKKWAARAVIDKVDKHKPQVVAQGSRTVFFERKPAARLADKTECDGTIAEGCASVVLGRDPGTYVAINPEVPKELEWLATGFMIAGALATMGAGLQASRLAKNAANAEAQLAKGQAGTASGPKLADAITKGEPVDVASGAVVSSGIDIQLPGAIPVVLTRTYSSVREGYEGDLGAGGWVHSFEQWVDVADVVTFHDGEGREVYFGHVEPNGTILHRRERLELTRHEDGTVSIVDLVAMQTRLFVPDEDRFWLSEVRDAHGNATAIFRRDGRLTSIIDTAGRELRFDTDPDGRITRIEVWARGDLTRWVDYAYHPSGEVASITDAARSVYSYEYDGRHRLVKTTFPNGQSFHYVYDDRLDRCIRTWGDGGLHANAFEYDLVERSTRVTGGAIESVCYWNDGGLVVREETLDGECLLFREYTPDHLVAAEGPSRESLTRFVHDARGNLVSRVDPAGNEETWEIERDRPVRHTTPDGLTTTFEHDTAGRLIRRTMPTGRTYFLDWDCHGRLAAIRDGDALLRRHVHDTEHNVVETWSGRGGVTKREYGPLGELAREIDATGAEWSAICDVLGRPVEVRAPDGGVTHLEYEPLGHVRSVVDPMGGITRIEYSGTGMPARVEEPDGGIWHLQYDVGERVAEILNPALERYAFEYDGAGRLRREHTFDGRSLGYRYDTSGALHIIDYPDSTFRELVRDALGNVLQEVTREDRIEYERDKLGRLLSAAIIDRSGKRVTRFERDAFGRVVTEAQDDKVLRFEHDDRDLRTARVLPNGATTLYEYDALGALRSVTQDGTRFALERDILGREVSRRAAEAELSIEKSYDPMGRLAGLRVGGARTSIVSARAFQYDLSGRLTRTSDSRWGATSYAYDGLGRLLESVRNGIRERFAYDATGELRSALSGLGEGNKGSLWETDVGNLLLQTEKNTYRYDARGRRVAKVSKGQGEGPRETRYSWDVRDRLIEVENANGMRVRFTYDAFGRRTRKEVLAPGAAKSKVVDFLWDGYALASDRESVRQERVFVHEPGTLIPMLQAEEGGVYAVVTDHLGAPKELVTREGRVVWSAAHSAWGTVIDVFRGEKRSSEHGPESPFRLLGQYHDEETGLCHTAFRYFDPEVGRWCSPDPLGIAAGFDLHQFDGAPTNEVDPLGLCKVATGGIGPVQQGAAGVERAIADLEASGGRVLGREITIEAGGVRTRPDLLVELPNGQQAFLEVKTGASAKLTPNQAAAFPQISTQGGVPQGANAAAAGLMPGMPIGPTPVWTVHYPWPLP